MKRRASGTEAYNLPSQLCLLSRKSLCSICAFRLNLLIMAEIHTGGCYCGAVEMEMRSEPLEMG